MDRKKTAAEALKDRKAERRKLVRYLQDEGIRPPVQEVVRFLFDFAREGGFAHGAVIIGCSALDFYEGELGLRLENHASATTPLPARGAVLSLAVMDQLADNAGDIASRVYVEPDLPLLEAWPPRADEMHQAMLFPFTDIQMIDEEIGSMTEYPRRLLADTYWFPAEGCH